MRILGTGAWVQCCATYAPDLLQVGQVFDTRLEDMAANQRLQFFSAAQRRAAAFCGLTHKQRMEWARTWSARKSFTTREFKEATGLIGYGFEGMDAYQWLRRHATKVGNVEMPWNRAQTMCVWRMK